MNYIKNVELKKIILHLVPGTMGIIRNCCEILVQENYKVLGISPQFPRFISEVELRRGLYSCYQLSKKNNYKLDIQKFLEYIDDSYSLISIENPNNPTGQIIDIKDIEKIVKKAKENNIYVFIDEAYGDYMDIENSSINLIKEYDNVIVCRSGSKYYGIPNHRVGYLFASLDFLKVYNKISLPFPFSDFSASVFNNILINKNVFDDTKIKTRNIKKKIFESIDKKFIIDSNFESPIFVVRTNKRKDLAKILLGKGVVVESCKCYIGLDERYVRIRINEQYDELIKILKKVL